MRDKTSGQVLLNRATFQKGNSWRFQPEILAEKTVKQGVSVEKRMANKRGGKGEDKKSG